MAYKDPEARKKYHREYEQRRRANRTPEQHERDKAYQREYRRRNPEKIRDKINGWRSRHPDSRRAEAAKRRYGLTLAEYDEMIAGKCALCDRKAAVVDHCHETGRVRGALCNSHNVALGQFGDDPERLEEAAQYLRAHYTQLAEAA